jgi:hypothetical protein
MDRGRHEDAGQATECFWGPQERECLKGETTVRVAVLSMVPGLKLDTVQTEVADCKEATEVECEVERAVASCGC